MAEGGFDDFEMQNMEKENEREEETNFESQDDLEKEYGLLGDLQKMKQDDDTPFIPNVDQDVNIPDVKKDAAAIRKIIIADKKKSFKEIFDLPLKKKYGKNSTLLLDKTRFEKERNGNVAIVFKDKKIGNFKNNKLELFKRKNKTEANEFKNVMGKVRDEYYKTLDFTFYQHLEPDWKDFDWNPKQMKKEVIFNSLEKLNEIVDDSKQKIKNIQEDNRLKPPPNEMRELNEIFDPKGETPQEKIDFLEKQVKYWKRRETQVTQKEMKQWYQEAEKITRNQAEKIRLENEMRPEEETTVAIIQQEIDNTDLGRYERFKKWAKKKYVWSCFHCNICCWIYYNSYYFSKKWIKTNSRSSWKIS